MGKQSSSTIVTKQDVAHIAQLANLSVSDEEEKKFATTFTATLEEISKLQDLDTSSIEPLHHVTGLKNVWRSDEVDQDRMLSQESALSQAHLRFNGYFVVDRIIEEQS